jgi:hypothetical protein
VARRAETALASARLTFNVGQKTMDAADFAKIEGTLRISLPAWYKSTLISYPFPSEESELFASADEVIRRNEDYRKEGWFDFPWPAAFFILGEDGCGNVYFAHLEGADQRIFIADHDGGPEPKKEELEDMVSSGSLDAHIRQTFEIQKKADELALARSKKKWWQFWL